ncbi:FecR family protein [Mucilaginibacter pedocola]|uniref:FecR protein domain-containing protein n=1 Tax=Mucilaginibacter pedocola TaxID=1792845 RepID=A0A1S9PE11_9SPHI|nr:FecR family protein [Mucilaginibacter pedocola]OOQ59147.1 hypothetical protein BC343_29440 [Mucilaginibacter pedocola]
MNPNRTEEQLKELLGKYLDGTATHLESKQVEEWFEAMGNRGTPDDIFSSPGEEGEEYNRVLSNIHSAITPVAQQSSFQKRRFTALRLKVASVAAMLLVVAGAFYYLHNKPVQPEAVRINTAIAEAGKMKLVELADGTKIWLNSTSKLSYPEHFSEKVREVTLLEGEAFFDIAHEAKRPFIVHSKGINTQVLGTSFNVNAYSYSNKIEVTVSTGKVAVSVGSGLLGYLTPKEQIKYNLLTGKILKQNVASTQTPWMNGDIVLDYVDFESLKAILFNNFNYHLKSKGTKVINLHFSATIKKTDSIANVMKLLSSINNTGYTLHNNEITMY